MQYEGTHNYHNFTVRKPASAPDVKRYILSFRCGTGWAARPLRPASVASFIYAQGWPRPGRMQSSGAGRSSVCRVVPCPCPCRLQVQGRV